MKCVICNVEGGNVGVGVAMGMIFGAVIGAAISLTSASR